MSTSLHYFLAEILSPISGEVVQVEATYSVRDVGCLPSHREYRAVISSVTDIVGAELLPLLSAEAVDTLEVQAFADWQDDCNVTMFGNEDV